MKAKLSGALDSDKGKNFRMGHNRLLEYFRKAAPDPNNPGRSFFNEDAITYLSKVNALSPCPHWCGIFALWAHKAANINVGCVIREGNYHYILIGPVYFGENGQEVMDTIEGNTNWHSEVARNEKSINLQT